MDIDYAAKGTDFACPSYFPDCRGEFNSGFDSGMHLYDSSGNGIADNDDSDISSGAGGSFTEADSFLQLSLAPGLYFIRISDFPLLPLVAPESYALQVSVVGHAIPEPSPLLLIVLSITILIMLQAKARITFINSRAAR